MNGDLIASIILWVGFGIAIASDQGRVGWRYWAVVIGWFPAMFVVGVMGIALFVTLPVQTWWKRWKGAKEA